MKEVVVDIEYFEKEDIDYIDFVEEIDYNLLEEDMMFDFDEDKFTLTKL